MRRELFHRGVQRGEEPVRGIAECAAAEGSEVHRDAHFPTGSEQCRDKQRAFHRCMLHNASQWLPVLRPTTGTPVLQRKRRGEHLAHVVRLASVPRTLHLRFPVHSHCELALRMLRSLWLRSQPLRKLAHLVLRGRQQVPVAHLPVSVYLILQQSTDPAAVVQLPRAPAALPAAIHEVVAEERARGARHCARRALRAVSEVLRDSVLGRLAGTHHFEAVELGRHHEDGPCVRGICDDGLHLSRDILECRPAEFRRLGAVLVVHRLSQVRERGRLKHSDVQRHSRARARPRRKCCRLCVTFETAGGGIKRWRGAHVERARDGVPVAGLCESELFLEPPLHGY